MAVSKKLRTFAITLGALCGGVALGALLPTGSTRETQPASSTQNGSKNDPGAPGSASNGGAPKADPAATLRLKETLLEFKEYGSLGKLPPQKLISLFEKVSNLRSDTRKYILAYRLASQMELPQVEEALKSALQDLSDGDYVTTRALARRWTELDPKGAAAKAIETKQQHLMIPVMESWTRMDPAGPLAWALQQDPATRAEAVRPLLMGKLLDQPQLEKLVMNAGSSESNEMRTQIFPFATSRLAETNPKGALHAASSVEDGDLRQRSLLMVMSRLAQTAPEEGRAWLASQQDIPIEQKQQLEQVLNNPRAGGARRGIQ